ncbi:MAG: EamA/RhaT family transporter [Candidatus Methanomethylicota archaeon]|uniref:EamA/RhaT family transporter n=1 Tax=Thermoproteota archaeon TaxID=2056631 RepID=A0A497F375_9CREN|nr:MAG: EamA/RhaT family transporter [Candidatus Verstraetearchaeota archaeon]
MKASSGVSNSKFKGWISLLVAVVGVSWASIFVVLSSAPGVVCAFWRLTFSSILTWLALMAIERRVKFVLNHLFLTFISGLFLAAHFAFWMESLFMVPVAISTTIVCSHPLFSSFLGFMVMGEKPRIIQLAGSIIAILGLLLLVTSTSQLAGELGLLGVVYALIGALTVAAYFTIGKFLRRKLNTLTYTALVYSWATLAILMYALILHVDLIGYDLKSWLAFLALAFIPMLLGHTMLNYALKYFSLIAVTTVTLGEPVGASLLAMMILGEQCDVITYFSITITLVGIALTLFGERDGEA